MVTSLADLPRPGLSDLITAIALRDPRLVTSIVQGMRRALVGADDANSERAPISQLLRQIERDCQAGAFTRARTTIMRYDKLFTSAL